MCPVYSVTYVPDLVEHNDSVVMSILSEWIRPGCALGAL
jgi:hypothetical protein